MFKYVSKKLINMIIMLFAISIVSFMLIQLPPGDYLTTYIGNLQTSGESINEAEIEALRQIYGLDKSMLEQYFIWMGNIFKGNLGMSFQWNKPVVELLASRIGITVLISVLTLILTYIFAIITGIFSAVKQYSIGDYILSVLAFIGMSIPNFILAITLVYASFKLTGNTMTGLFSMEFINEPWTWAKVVDMLKHLPYPIFVGAVGGTASMFRITRGCMLDELNKTYVEAARARGVSERKLLFKYPTRIALNPVISSIGWMLPNLISGGTIIAIVLNIPTVAPLLHSALKAQDMYLAGAIVIFLSFLVIIGTFISDLLLMVIDPRIKLQG